MLALLSSLMHRHEGTILESVHQRAVDDVSTLMLSLMDNHKGTMLEFLVRKRRYIHKKMSAAQVGATLAKCNLKMRQWRNIFQCMKRSWTLMTSAQVIGS